ncbi:MAG: hypothetical protein ACOC0D_06515 [Spirochaeta sp.]
MNEIFTARLEALRTTYNSLIERKNERLAPGNGIYTRYRYPILTADHAPIEWCYDLDPRDNPYLMQRMGINAVFNAGAILEDGRYTLVCRVEGADRKSFFAVAQSDNGIDGFQFVGEPLTIPYADHPETNVYDMRLTRHEDGWIYGIFCAERRDPEAPANDTVSAVAAAGIVRTKDLRSWERLPDLKTPSPQQRNVVLHPELVDGRYMLYTGRRTDLSQPAPEAG